MHEISLHDSIAYIWMLRVKKNLSLMCDNVRIHVFMSKKVLNLLKEYWEVHYWSFLRKRVNLM
jgi:hypothetical protein